MLRITHKQAPPRPTPVQPMSARSVQGLGDAACGVTTDTKYSEEYVRPIAASYETDGSVFLLWERRAKYSDRGDGRTHSEDVCGVTYLKKDADGMASVIATFRQPSPVRLLCPASCAACGRLLGAACGLAARALRCVLLLDAARRNVACFAGSPRRASAQPLHPLRGVATSRFSATTAPPPPPGPPAVRPSSMLIEHCTPTAQRIAHVLATAPHAVHLTPLRQPRSAPAALTPPQSTCQPPA